MNEKVSVLVPTFNRAKYIRRCIDGILSQTVAPHEVIVIDDGSSDETPKILREYGPRITYLRQDNAGKSAALNFGMRHVEGSYVWLFDDDDVAMPDSIETRLNVFRKDSSLGFVGSGHSYGRDDCNGGIEVVSRRNMRSYPKELNLYKLLVSCYFTLPSVLARKQCYDDAGVFDQSLTSSEDYDMLIRLASRFDYKIIPDPTFIVRLHDGVRGSMSMNYPARKRRIALSKTDKVVGLKLRKALDISSFYVDSDPDKDRIPYLRRAVVMASKGLISEMMTDLLKIYKGDKRSGITGLERDMCIEAIESEYAIDGMIGAMRVYLEGMISLVRSGRAGSEVGKVIVEGIWRMNKERKLSLSRRLERIFLLLVTAPIVGFSEYIKRFNGDL